VRSVPAYVTLTRLAPAAPRSGPVPLELMRLVPSARSALR
jgi:hypothetical protein